MWRIFYESRPTLYGAPLEAPEDKVTVMYDIVEPVDRGESSCGHRSNERTRKI